MNTSIFKSGDKILIVGIIVIAGLVLAWNSFGDDSNQRLTAVITHDSNLVKQIDLSGLNRTQTIDLNNEGIHQVIRAEKGRIRFIESNCPNKTCVNTGWLTKPGDQAVCIPSHMVVKVVGKKEQTDVLAY